MKKEETEVNILFNVKLNKHEMEILTTALGMWQGYYLTELKPDMLRNIKKLKAKLSIPSSLKNINKLKQKLSVNSNIK